MVDAAAAHPDLVTGVGVHVSAARRPSPRSASRSTTARSARSSHFNGHYWCDYGRSAADPDELALQGRPGLGCAGRHRQPPGRPGRVPLRADDPVARRRLRRPGHRARLPLGTAVGHAAAPAQRRQGAGRERGPRHVHRALRLRRGRHVLRLAGRLRAAPTRWASSCSPSGAADLRPGPAGRVPVIRQRAPTAGQRLPPGARRPGPPVPHRRPADGLPRRRLRPERPVRLPGAGLPRAGRRARRRPAPRARPSRTDCTTCACSRRRSASAADGGRSPTSTAPLA